MVQNPWNLSLRSGPKAEFAAEHSLGGARSERQPQEEADL